MIEARVINLGRYKLSFETHPVAGDRTVNVRALNWRGLPGWRLLWHRRVR